MSQDDEAGKAEDATPGRNRFGEPTSTTFNGVDPPRNFTFSVDERIRALTIGVPAWSARKRRIEDLEEKLVGDLVTLHAALVAKRLDARAIDAALEARAAGTNLTRLNEQIALHNRYYPIEANLRMDPETGGYLVSGRRWQPERAWTVARLLDEARAVLLRER